MAMRCGTALALLSLGLALPVCAQRGGGHGGFSGHGASTFSGSSRSGGFGAPARSGYAPRSYPQASRFAGSRSLSSRNVGGRFQGASSRYPGAPSGAQPVFFSRAGAAYGAGRSGSNGYRSLGRDGRPRFGYPRGTYLGYLSYGFPYPFFDSFLDPFWNDFDAFGYDTAQTSGDAGAPYAGPPQDPGAFPPLGPEPQDPRLAQNPQPSEAPWVSPPPLAGEAPAEEDAVTLVFKDGRPSEQIHNYALTRTTLYVTGRHIREIPLDQIDLPATEQTNRAAGVDFRLPQAK